jgi:murein DD-endopeptidase MepM/ murein hydrolase activator NlpD
LHIDPDDELAQEALRQLSEGDLLTSAQVAILAGDKASGRRLLTRLLDQGPSDEAAWLWLSAAVTDEHQRRICLANALRTDPQSKALVERLAPLIKKGRGKKRASWRQDRLQLLPGALAGFTLTVFIFVLFMIFQQLIQRPVALIPLYTPAIMTPYPTDTPFPTLTPPPTSLPPTPSPTWVPPTPVPTLPPPPPTSVPVSPALPEPLSDLVEGVIAPDDTSPLFVVPVSGVIRSDFARAHPAIDFQAAVGTPIVATGAGQVVFSGFNERGYGNLVVIRHAPDWTSWYGHLDSIDVEEGAWICRGCPIGTLGNTGNSKTPHLHFELRRACVFYNVLTGEELGSGIASGYLYTPSGQPTCGISAEEPVSTSESVGGDLPADDPTLIEGGKGLEIITP